MAEIKLFRRRSWLGRLFGLKDYSVTLSICTSRYSADAHCRYTCPGWRYKSLHVHPEEKWILNALKREEYVNLPTAVVVK